MGIWASSGLILQVIFEAKNNQNISIFFGHRGIWVSEHLGISASGYLGIEAFGYLGQGRQTGLFFKTRPVPWHGTGKPARVSGFFWLAQYGILPVFEPPQYGFFDLSLRIFLKSPNFC